MEDCIKVQTLGQRAINDNHQHKSEPPQVEKWVLFTMWRVWGKRKSIMAQRRHKWWPTLIHSDTWCTMKHTEAAVEVGWTTLAAGNWNSATVTRRSTFSNESKDRDYMQLVNMAVTWGETLPMHMHHKSVTGHMSFITHNTGSTF